jgi:Fic/DOC family
MNKQIAPSSSLDYLEKHHPDALTLDQLATALPDLPKRTIQRHLAKAVLSGLIAKTGKARATRYQWIKAVSAKNKLSKGRLSKDDPIVWSPESLLTFELINRPLTARPPVGYQMKLLEDYIPNQTFYLPEPARTNLLLIGQTPVYTGLPTDTPMLLGTLAKQVLDRLLIDLSWASSHLEGNTYSHLDTAKLIQRGLTASDKNPTDAQMILNHKAAIEYLVLTDVPRPLDRNTINALHVFLSDGLINDPMDGGRIRSIPVEIYGSSYRPLALPASLDALLTHVLSIANEIQHPLEQSLFLMVHLPYLQPFIDVNKRVSRLAANIPLIAANLAPLSFINVPPKSYSKAVLAVYERLDTRPLADVFCWAYERACQDYNAQKQNQVAPDLFRLTHRTALFEAVASKVRTGRYAMPKSVPLDAREKFKLFVEYDLKTLTVTNSIKFGLRPLEAQAWIEKRDR